MWTKLPTQEYCCLEFDANKYTFWLIQNSQVYIQELSASEISLKGSNSDCPLDLANPIPMLEFMHKQITAGAIELDLPNFACYIDFKSLSLSYKWKIEVSVCTPTQSVNALFKLVSSLESQISESQTLLNDKTEQCTDLRLVVNGMADAIQRRSDYRVPQALAYALNDS